MSILSRLSHDKSRRPPSKRDRWWDELPLDFYNEAESFELGRRDRMQVNISAAGDVFTRTLAAVLLGTTALPFGFSPARLRTLEAEGEFYGQFADRRAHAEFFVPPPQNVHVSRSKAATAHFPPDGGYCEDLRFLSPYEARRPEYRRELSRNTKNRVAHARHWFHADGPRPTIIAIHGFSADFYRVNEWFFALPWMYHKLGMDVLLFTMPHHGARRDKYSPFSGHGFFSGGISGINEAFGQAVHDFRVFFDHLRARGSETIGVGGVSLGGFTSALLASVEPRLAFAIPNVPLVSVVDLALEWRPAGDMIRALMKVKGFSLPQLRRYLAVTSALTYQPLLPKERLMIIGGIGDRLASPQHSHELWEHWDRPKIYWFPGSHFLHFDRGRYLRETARFLRNNKILPARKTPTNHA